MVEIFIKRTDSGVFTKNFLSSSLGKFSVFVFKVGKALVKLAFVVFKFYMKSGRHFFAQ